MCGVGRVGKVANLFYAHRFSSPDVVPLSSYDMSPLLSESRGWLLLFINNRPNFKAKDVCIILSLVRLLL